MARVLDVAKYILQQQGRITPMKLQKLVYYAQVWWSAEHDDALFPETIKAWAQGPVVPPLFQAHKGRASIDHTAIQGDASALSSEERSAIDEVLSFYGSFSAQYLSQLTHHEPPWRQAHEVGEKEGHASPTISVAAIRAFYRGRSPAQLNAEYKLTVAREIMKKHEKSLARLAL